MSNLDKRLSALEVRLNQARSVASQPANVLDAAKASLQRMASALGPAEVARSGGLKAWVARYFGAGWIAGSHGLDALVLAAPFAWEVKPEEAEEVLTDSLAIFNGLLCSPPEPPPGYA